MMDNEIQVTVKKDAMAAFGSFNSFRNTIFVLLMLALIVQITAFWLVQSGVVAEGGPASGQNSTEPTANFAININAYNILDMALHYSQIIAIYAAILYCLALIMGLKILLAGQLPGVTGNTKAMFLSLILLVIIIPWQATVAIPLNVALFNSAELFQKYSEFADYTTLKDKFCYFFRFSGMNLLALIFLFVAQGYCRGASAQVKQVVNNAKHKIQQRLAAEQWQNRPMPSENLKMTPDKPPIPLENFEEIDEIDNEKE